MDAQDELRQRANSLEFWLEKNIGDPDYESKNREHNILLAKMRAFKQAKSRRSNPNAAINSGLKEVYIPTKYNL